MDGTSQFLLGLLIMSIIFNILISSFYYMESKYNNELHASLWKVLAYSASNSDDDYDDDDDDDYDDGGDKPNKDINLFDDYVEKMEW